MLLFSSRNTEQHYHLNLKQFFSAMFLLKKSLQQFFFLMKPEILFLCPPLSLSTDLSTLLVLKQLMF